LQVYMIDTLPSKTAMQTDSLDAGGAVNVPLDPVTVTGTLAATSIHLVVTTGGTISGWLRAGAH
jgi:hypothetical protein